MFAPKVAVITNIEPDHLDVHDDFEDYVSAKMNISRLQDSSDYFIYNSDDGVIKDSVKKLKAENSATYIPFPNKKFAHIDTDYF